ncbi:uncharacterized protein LOC143225752 [Tachypleus tridentatus]|uniref:uncharacterized protein LOC143225752 n=1 Tax=Tachypleus tridentatus TaxID=6853 RepID=UPI003FD4AFBE
MPRRSRRKVLIRIDEKTVVVYSSAGYGILYKNGKRVSCIVTSKFILFFFIFAVIWVTVGYICLALSFTVHISSDTDGNPMLINGIIALIVGYFFAAIGTAVFYITWRKSKRVGQQQNSSEVPSTVDFHALNAAQLTQILSHSIL